MPYRTPRTPRHAATRPPRPATPHHAPPRPTTLPIVGRYAPAHPTTACPRPLTCVVSTRRPRMWEHGCAIFHDCFSNFNFLRRRSYLQLLCSDFLPHTPSFPPYSPPLPFLLRPPFHPSPSANNFQSRRHVLARQPPSAIAPQAAPPASMSDCSTVIWREASQYETVATHIEATIHWTGSTLPASRLEIGTTNLNLRCSNWVRSVSHTS